MIQLGFRVLSLGFLDSTVNPEPKILRILNPLNPKALQLYGNLHLIPLKLLLASASPESCRCQDVWVGLLGPVARSIRVLAAVAPGLVVM